MAPKKMGDKGEKIVADIVKGQIIKGRSAVEGRSDIMTPTGVRLEVKYIRLRRKNCGKGIQNLYALRFDPMGMVNVSKLLGYFTGGV